MKWYLVIQFFLLTPQRGDVLVQSQQWFDTQEVCEQHRKAIEVDAAVKEIFGIDSTHRDAKISCKELGHPGTPA